MVAAMSPVVPLHASPPPDRRRGRDRARNVPRLLARLYAQAAPDVRSRLLAVLLRPVGPLALVAIGAGAFARLLPHSRWQGLQIGVEEAQQVDPRQIFELAFYVEQKCPELLAQLPQLVSDPRLWIGSATGALLLLVLRQRQNRG